MTSAAMTPLSDADRISEIFQYTVEAYKMFQKLSEMLPNPMAAHVYENLAEDERATRDLIEIKYSDPRVPRTQITLEHDLRFQDALEGDLSYVELTEFLIVRETTMERRLVEAAKTASEADRNLYLYIASARRAHVAYMERELQMLRLYPDWYKREDAESLVVFGRVGKA
ncbi:MAG TPA: hypothetical protein VM557_03600 [Thermoanaerobaculia bacterium]|nr:hypothetical protein [Thermoanaerobaculia bacterium]